MLSSLYDTARRLAPYPVRRWFKSQPWFVPVFQAVFGNDVYSESYFEDIERREKESVQHVADWVTETLAPQSVIDVGCGPGHQMEAFEQRGVDTFGIDVSNAALRRTRRKGLDVKRFDLRSDESLPGGPHDLSVCCEVAEHIKEKHAESLVKKLTEAAPIVYMTAAEPDGGPGLFHVNEQPHEYWIALMEAEGYYYDEETTRHARHVLGEKSVVPYLARPLIFREEK